MSSANFALQHISILRNVADKNSRAEQIVRDYASKHALMDIGVGAISLLPGAAIPALFAAIALQNDIIYKPMAKDLAAIYLSETDSYTDRLGNVASVATAGVEFAQEFALEFLAEQAQELIMDVGFGALATLIPFASVVAGVALDYLIAQMMTWRVGTMTAIYFQNGGEWVEDRKRTIEIAKGLTGGLRVSVSQLLSKKAADSQKVRVDFDDIPLRVSEVKKSGVDNIIPLIRSFADKLPRSVVRESLIAMGLSAIMVDGALLAYYG